MDDMVTLVLDGDADDEYMYKKDDESDAEYKVRLARLRERRNARMSDEEKRIVEETIKCYHVATL